MPLSQLIDVVNERFGTKFELVFKNVLDRLFVDRMDQNEEVFVRFMNDLPFQKIVTAWMASEVYRPLRNGAVESDERDVESRDTT